MQIPPSGLFTFVEAYQAKEHDNDRNILNWFIVWDVIDFGTVVGRVFFDQFISSLIPDLVSFVD